MNQDQEPMGPLMKAMQKWVITIVCILDAMLFIGAIRYIPVLYTNWLFWVGVVLSILVLVLLLPILKDMHFGKSEK